MKSAFITGANRGLGYGFVEHLLSQNYTVFAGARKITDSLLTHENLTWIQCDVADDGSIDNAIAKISEKTGSLTYLINNAGVNKDTIQEGDKNLVSKLEYLDRNALLNMFNINTISPIILTKKFLPLLAKADQSFIINISSARASFHDGHAGSTPNYGYASTKVALNMLTFCTEEELPSNVKTFAVNPGGVMTDMNSDGKAVPIERAEQIINLTKNWKDEYNARFVNYNGDLYSL